jgi:UDP-2,4-diacetamido-2,4,6-trideoxy-beta-L-altropyranose hydrolase
MRIAFRTDVSRQIGTGHFMRCFSLADELRKQGSQICFISINLPIYLRDMLIEKGMEHIPLIMESTQEQTEKISYVNGNGDSQIQDAQASIQVLANQDWDWIIVDHYALDQSWESLVRTICKKLMVIDDLADRKHDCDVLLDQNYYAEMQKRYIGMVPPHCQLLLGPHYALLRENFRALRKLTNPRIGVVKKILVFFGGIDADDYTTIAIHALAELREKYLVDVVIGEQHPNHKQIQLFCDQFGYICHIQTARMAELMAEADLAIGAGGSASWERCCLGVPSLVMAVADNQIEISKALDSINACFYVEAKKAQKLIAIRSALSELLNTPRKIHSMSQEAFQLVDGRGVIRVRKVLGC